MTTARKSRILEEMHETVHGLHNIGLIDKRRMRELDILCKIAVKPLSSEQIRSLRKNLHVSQAVFAALLNTSLSTVQKWEIGEKHPSGPSLKLLSILDSKGIEALI